MSKVTNQPSNQVTRVYLAADHAGFQLKEAIKKFLIAEGYTVEDLGAFTYNETDDYPDFIKLAAEMVSKCSASTSSATKDLEYAGNIRTSDVQNIDVNAGTSEVQDIKQECRAIIIGGSGQGEAMVANRYKGVKAAVVYAFDEAIVRLSREHNDANILSLGARFLKEEDALKAVKLWLNTPFSGEERHKRRIAKIDKF